MSTAVRASTAVYAVTHIAGNIGVGLKRLVVGCGLDPMAIINSWTSTEKAVITWLRSRHLTRVMLEVWDPTRAGAPLVGRFDFDIEYDYYGDGDGELWMDTAYISSVIRKNGSLPSHCSYRVLCSVSPGAPEVPGWGDAELRSTVGMRRHSIGTTLTGRPRRDGCSRGVPEVQVQVGDN
jgi:Bacterial HORMA domain 2